MSLNDRGFIQLLNILIMKNFKNLGKALSKTEQKNVLGGGFTTPPEEGQECIEGMCANMPNPDWNLGSNDIDGSANGIRPNQNGSPFVQGVCRDGVCYYQ